MKMNKRFGSLVAALAVFSAHNVIAETNSAKSVTAAEAATEQVLTAPVAGEYTAVIADDHDRNTVFFTWTPAGMQPLKRLNKTWTEDHYRICLFDGDSCSSSKNSQVFEFVPGTRDIPPFRYRPADHALKIDLAFQESTFRWAVAGCLRDTGQCSAYSISLPVRWTQKRLPVLLAPEDGEVRDPMIKTMFRWDATEDAEFYLLCLAKPGINCPSKMVPPSEDLFVLVLPNTQRQAYLQTLLNSGLSDEPLDNFQQARLHGQKMQWTVGICRDGKCKYQPKMNAISFDRGRAEIHVRNNSSFDINDLWLVDQKTGRQTQLTHDMHNYRTPGALKFRGGKYDDDYLTRVQRQHLGKAEPEVAPYYAFAFTRERVAGSRSYEQNRRKTVSFAPGIQYLPDYTVERETLFIMDDGSRLEQILRGPDGERYVYRPAGSFSDIPDVGPGPVLLSTLRNTGYKAY